MKALLIIVAAPLLLLIGPMMMAHAQSIGTSPLGVIQATGLSPSAALSPIPAGATSMVVCVETQGVRWRDDGTAPTASVGMPIAAGQCAAFHEPNLSLIKFIYQVSGEIIDAWFGTP